MTIPIPRWPNGPLISLSKINQLTPPPLWEYAQPYIHHLLLNARTFDRQVTQRYFRDWEALASENALIWAMDYQPCPLYDAWPAWDAWLPEYRQLILEVQAISEEHKACGTVET